MWRVHWVGRGTQPNSIEGVWPISELIAREAGARISEGSPFMTDPNGDVDPFLTAYFNSAIFRRLASESQRSYLDDYRVYFNFLWQHEKRWLEASTLDVEDYEDWRRRAPNNPRRISGAKWTRELSAINRLYRWATQWQLMSVNPVRTVVATGREGTRREFLEASAHDVRASNVKWLTPRMWKLWRDVGLMGYGSDGIPRSSYRGRNAERNAAYADLLFDSGLRRTEGASLLTIEIPKSGELSLYKWGRVARAVAKYQSGRPFCVSSSSMAAIRAYGETDRARVVRSAQKAGRYNAMKDKLLVKELHSSGGELFISWRDEAKGLDRKLPIDRVTVAERERLFKQTKDGLEPMWFWLSQEGLPFKSHSWEAVFQSATQRCRQVIGDGAPYCTPHMARHSFALIMLVALYHMMDPRLGVGEQQRKDTELLFGNPWRMVKDLLGHKSEETTRNVYLAPVRDIQIRTLLEGDLKQGIDFLQALAAAGGRVQDVPYA